MGWEISKRYSYSFDQIFEFSLGSCGALTKFPMLRFPKATAPTVFIKFQPNFIVSILIMTGYRLLLFWRFAKM